MLPDTSIVVGQCQGGKRGANHFHRVFLRCGSGPSQADVHALKYGMGDRWRRVTPRGQGMMMFDRHETNYRRAFEAQEKWAIDPLDRTNPVQVVTFIKYMVWYFAKGDNQMARVKPMAKARTLTMGR